MIYQLLPPNPAVEGLEGDEVLKWKGHVLQIIFVFYLYLHCAACSDGTPKPERRMGRSLAIHEQFDFKYDVTNHDAIGAN